MLSLILLVFSSGINSIVIDSRYNYSSSKTPDQLKAIDIVYQNLNDKSCGLNEEYDSCGPVYENNCQNYLQPSHNRRRKCVCGCFCKEGYIRDLKTESCVLPQFCDWNNVCDQNESFQLCGKECDFCDSDHKLMRRENCSDCLIGCFCKQHFVRNMTDNKCIPIDSCS